MRIAHLMASRHLDWTLELSAMSHDVRVEFGAAVSAGAVSASGTTSKFHRPAVAQKIVLLLALKAEHYSQRDRSRRKGLCTKNNGC